MARPNEKQFWHDHNTSGKHGEELFYKYAWRNPAVADIQPTEYEDQIKGKDFYLYLKSGKTVSIEVKYSPASGQWHNHLIELKTNRQKQGWLYTCQADFIVFIEDDTRGQKVVRGWIISPKKLQKWIKTNRDKRVIKWVAGDMGAKSTLGAFIPLKDMPGKKVIIKQQ